MTADQATVEQAIEKHVFVAGDRNQRTIQMPGHVLNEASLTAARGPFQHNRELRAVCRLEQTDLLAYRQIVRLAPDDVFFYRLFYCGLICSHK